MEEAEIRKAFFDQARFCEDSRAPVTASVVRTLEAALDRTTETGRRVLDWVGNPRGSADSVPLRLAGGMHALGRRDVDPRLAKLYRGDLTDAAVVVAHALRRFDADLVAWLDSPPQTNETGRAAPIMAGLLLLAAKYDLPFELIELGASAGLNLNLDRFGYRLGGVEAGDPQSPVKLTPSWDGAPPPHADVRVLDRHGVDQSPIRITDPAARERLMAYCWADQPERMARLEASLGLADAFPPLLDQGDAADFAETRLARPHPDGVTRVLYHTIFWSYLPPDKQARIRTALERAGKAATMTRPLAWLRYELNEQGTAAELHLQQWPGGSERHLATGHPHGTKLSWHGNPG